jgi:predicted methyltransferase
MTLESWKNLEIMSGRLTSLIQTFPWSSVYFILHDFPEVVEPASIVVTNKKAVLVEYL